MAIPVAIYTTRERWVELGGQEDYIWVSKPLRIVEWDISHFYMTVHTACAVIMNSVKKYHCRRRYNQ